MHYFGVPSCPYCKKRVNLIRTWSLKRQGEYQCPRCGGISNIYLSPLVYVLALLAVFGAGAMYFFHKFVLDDITLETALYVFLPFAVFFLFSVFMVYLEKPVIKKVSKEEYQKKRSIRAAVAQAPNVRTNAAPPRNEYYNDDDYVPRGNYRPGPDINLSDERHGVVNQAAFTRAKRQAALENNVGSVPPRRTPQSQQSQQVQQEQQAQSAQRSAQRAPQAQRTQQQARPAAQPMGQQPARQQNTQQGQQRQAAPRGAAAQRQRSAQQNAQQGASMKSQPRQQQNRAVAQSRTAQPQQTVRTAQPQYRATDQAQAARYDVPRQSGRVVNGVETPVKQNSYLDRYNDPAYVQRRLQEIDGSGQNRQ